MLTSQPQFNMSTHYFNQGPFGALQRAQLVYLNHVDLCFEVELSQSRLN